MLATKLFDRDAAAIDGRLRRLQDLQTASCEPATRKNVRGKTKEIQWCIRESERIECF